MSTSSHARLNTARIRIATWFYGAGQYWVLALLTLVTMLSYRGRWLPQMSPIDEATYLDVIFKFPNDLVAQGGEYYGPEIREKFACDGNHVFGKAGPACGSDYSDPNAFPQSGKTTADAYFPLFFWIAGIVSRFLSLFGIDLTIGARLSMLIFGVATMLILYKAMRMLSVPIGVAYSVLTLAMMTPVFWWTFGYLSTDAPVILFGSLVFLITIGFLQGTISLWWLAPVAAAGMLFKVTTFLGIGLAVLIVMLYQAVQKVPSSVIPGMESSRQIPTKQWIIPSGVALLVGIITLVSWEIIRRLIAVADSPSQGLTMGRTSKSEVIYEAQAVLRNLLDAGHGESTATPFSFLLTSFLSFLLVAGVVGAMLRRPTSRLEFSLTWATGIAAVTFLPILYVTLKYAVLPFSLPPRYALAILPAMLGSVALSIRWVGARWLIGAITIVAWFYFVFSGMTYIPQA